jgi:hypothetical protein
LAWENPWFSQRTTRAPGKRETTSAVPSVEPLSATTTSSAIGPAWA